MKKQYTTPAAQSVALYAEENILAGSPIKMYDTDGTTSTAGSEALSNGRGWNSSDWTAAEED